MTKKLKHYISLIKEIQNLKTELANLVRLEKPFENVDEEFFITLVNEFPNSSPKDIELVARMLVGQMWKENDRISRKIWSMIDMGVFTLNSNLKLIVGKNND